MKEEIQRQVDSVPFWFHSLQLPLGITTRGVKTPEIHTAELKALKLPDLTGKTVLDIGAWDGFYSFEAERRGSRRVVSLDHYVWGIDHDGRGGAWPGKRPYDIAHAALNSRAESVCADFMTVDWNSIGAPFDVVFFMGVLYHLENPLAGLKRVAEATKGVAIIETAAIDIPAMRDKALCEFYETTELNGDPTNWWSPNEKALVGMCRAAGFSRVEVKSVEPSLMWPQKSTFTKTKEATGRALREAGILAPVPPPPDVIHYRAIVHAYR
jgi:tRNA (mo5U34)-methyltransferase